MTPKLTRKQWILTAVGVLVLGGMLVLVFRSPPVPVEVAAVKRAVFEQTIEEDGKTRVRERYVVSAPLAGRLSRVLLDPGDEVKMGATVATLSPAAPSMIDARTARELNERVGAATATLSQARATAARAEAAQEQANTDLARQQKLQSEGFVAPAALDQAQLAVRVHTRELEAARFAARGAEHDLAQARAALMRAQEGAEAKRPGTAWAITSPVDGRVLRVLQQSETVVAVGAPLIEIGDPHDLEIVVDVLSTDALRIPTGARVEVDAGAATKLQGRVRRIEPAAFTKVSALGVEEQRVNVLIDLTSPPAQWDNLGDNYRVDVKIITFARAEAVVVPVAALFRAGDDWAVFVAHNGNAQRRTVKLGGRTPLEAWVENGLAPGERVIVYPSDSVADGRRVDVIRGG